MLGVLAFLAAQNLVIFSRHYAGQLTFPDDFLLTYHAIPYHWIEAAKQGREIAWIPVQAMGYPLYMNLQSGHSYLPLWLFVWLDLVYSLHAAVIIQGLHVLAGALGAVVCARMQGLRWSAAMLAGALYQCFGGFYSNAQHPDIVRSYAFLPWLAGPVLSDWSRQSRLKTIGIAMLPAWTYAQWTGGYPGAAIASTLLLGGLALARTLASRQQALTGLLVLGAQAAGVLLAGIGTLPALLDARLIDRAGQLGSLAYDYLQARDVLALTFRVDGDFFAHDPSMRSLFIALPGIALVCASAGRFVPRQRWLIACLALALLMAMGPLHRIVINVMPQAGLSRFPMADYKGLIALMLVLLASQAFDRIDSILLARWFRPWPGVLALLLVLGIQTIEPDANHHLAWLAQATILVVGAACCWPEPFWVSGVRVRLPVLAGLIAVFAAFAFLHAAIPHMRSGLVALAAVSSVLAWRARLQAIRMSAQVLLAGVLAVLVGFYLGEAYWRPGAAPVRVNGIVVLAGLASATLVALAGPLTPRSRWQVAFVLAVLCLLDWTRVTWTQRFFAPPPQDGLPWVESVVGPFSQTRPELLSRLASGACRDRRLEPSQEGALALLSGYYTGQAQLLDHGIKLTRHKSILADSQLRSFAALPWRVVALRDGEDARTALRHTPSSAVTCIHADTTVTTYQVDLQAEAWVLENEVYWPGWSATLICRSGCTLGAVLEVEPTDVLGFRAWHLPTGKWEMRARFGPPHRRVAWAVTALGALAWMSVLALLCWAHRRGRPSAPDCNGLERRQS